MFHFWYLHEILNIFKEKLIVIGNVFPKLQTLKSLVRPLSKKPCFRTPFDSQHVKASNVLAKSPWECFYHFFSSFSRKSIWKISPLVLGEILGLFFNTLTAYDKYPVQDCENLPLPVQMQLSEKSKGIFSIFFFLDFWNLHKILNILKEKMIVTANVFAKLQTVKILLRPLSKKRSFRIRFYSQHVKGSQIHVK